VGQTSSVGILEPDEQLNRDLLCHRLRQRAVGLEGCETDE